jgi:hypothetical protein
MPRFCGVTVPGHGPIEPGEKRTLVLRRHDEGNAVLPEVTVSLVLFSDLQFEGLASERDDTLRLRGQMADRLAFAITVLSDAAGRRPEHIVPFLESKKRDRAVATAARPQGSDPTIEISEVIRQVKAGYGDPRTLVSEGVPTLEARLARLLRHRKP